MTNKFEHYFALQSPDDEDEWCICPKDFWEKNRYIPDYECDLKISGFYQCSEHIFEARVENPKETLEKLGFEILDNPDWYFV